MKPQSSILYKIRYNVVESPGAYLEICTTRPETIVGDVALAIHPEDPRWKNLQGKHDETHQSDGHPDYCG